MRSPPPSLFKAKAKLRGERRRLFGYKVPMSACPAKLQLSGPVVKNRHLTGDRSS
jgi:hypothetical protein